MTDQLTNCRKCGSHLCYELHNDSVVTWRCLSCGYETNTLLLNGTDTVLSFESTLPSLYKDIKFVDNEDFVWYPTIMNLVEQGIGIIFADGTSKDDWKWAVSLAEEVKPDQQHLYRDSKYKNSSKILHFDQDKFAIALQALGVI